VADFNASDVSNFMFLKTVNSFIPILNHFYQTGMSSPDQLYEVLVQLSGELMTFSVEGHPRDLPPYNHSDLSATFNDIDKILHTLLGKVVSPQNVIFIPLEKRSENIFVGNIQDDALVASGKFFLAIGCGDMSQADIIKYVPIKFKVSSADIILEIINSAMPGIEIRHIPIPPSSLPIKIGYEYFSIESSSDLWKHVNESKSIAIYIPKDLVTVELKLIAIKG
jgi:type VI secretion system protein ImpJ